MALTTPTYLPYGEPGSMSYTKSEPITNAVIPPATDIVNAIIAERQIPYESLPGRPFTLCDFGTADGGVSRPLIEACIDSIKKSYGSHSEVLVVYEDQVQNDFTGIIRQPITSPHVYTSVVARSFYEQCLPSGSLQLGFCFAALHWLSKLPCSIADGVFSNSAADSKAKEMFEAQAIQDWTQFLWCRSQELVSGGHMVFVIGIEKPPEMVNSATLYIYDCLNESWKTLHEDGCITQDEFRNANAFAHMCPSSAYTAQLAEGTALHSAGLRLKTFTLHTDLLTFNQYWPTSDFDGDEARAECFAERLTTSVREWSHAVFLGALAQSRSQQQKQQLLDQLYQRFRQHFKHNHAEFRALKTPMAFVVIEKVTKEG